VSIGSTSPVASRAWSAKNGNWPRSSAQLNKQGAGAGVADRLADVGAVGQGEHLGVGLDQVGEPVQQRAALGEPLPRDGLGLLAVDVSWPSITCGTNSMTGLP
jgi:hypothetical protein